MGFQRHFSASKGAVLFEAVFFVLMLMGVLIVSQLVLVRQVVEKLDNLQKQRTAYDGKKRWPIIDCFPKRVSP